MAKYEPIQRIKFAYKLEGWSYETGSQFELRRAGGKILPSEYTQDMEGKIFCPACFTNLTRNPKEADYFSNGRSAHFAHLRTYKHVKCDLRVKRSEGKKFDTYEEAQKAIDDENLVIIYGFLQEKPQGQQDPAGVYDETPIEDINGPVSEVPIARHSGESFSLPSKITTVAGICRNFDENLYKHYLLPGRQNAVRLIDLLKDVREVIEKGSTPRLYFGKIIRSYTPVKYPAAHNMRMTELAGAPSVRDFYLKEEHGISSSKGINDKTRERYVLMWGEIGENGIGLCIEGLNWGEFALLPAQYNHLLDT
jgi:hypothetical protein